jgi:hypothetical protein
VSAGDAAGGPSRILVLGCPGSGKSTLAAKLATATGLPLVHLDDEYWGPGWSRPDEPAWHRRQTALADRPQWIIEGNYLDTVHLRAARGELVVMVDTAPARCALRVLRRAHRIRRGDDSALPTAVRTADRSGPRPSATRDLGPLLIKIMTFRRALWWPTVQQACRNPDVQLVVAVGPGRCRARHAALRTELARRHLRALVLPLQHVVPTVRDIVVDRRQVDRRQPVAGRSDRPEGII